MFRLLRILIVSAMAPYLWGGPAHGGSTSADMTVSATVVKSATVSTATRALSRDDGVTAGATFDPRAGATIKVILPRGVSPAISLEKRYYPPGNETVGTLSDGAVTLRYEVYEDTVSAELRTASGAVMVDSRAKGSVSTGNSAARVRMPIRQTLAEEGRTATIFVINF